MSKSESIAKLAEALAKAQGEFPAVPMNAVNPFLKNRYADLGAVIETAKPILARHGLAVSQLVTSGQDGIGVTTVLMHSSGEWLESTAALPLGEERGKSLAQVAGSVVTYLRRYAYASILGLYADEDADGNGQPTPPPARKAAAAEAAAQATAKTGVPVAAGDSAQARAEAVRARVMTHPNGGPAEKGGRNKAAGALHILETDDAKRRGIRLFLCGGADAESMTNGQCEDIARWINVQKVDGDWVPSTQSIEDAKVILAHVMAQA